MDDQQQQTVIQSQQTPTAEAVKQILCPTIFDQKNMEELK